jgi:hypothetical protein
LAKNPKNPSALIDDPLRCEICSTTLTLYPKVFAACPHCHKTVCRLCWGEAWAGKAFTAEACAHLSENSGLNVDRMGEKRGGLQLDWQKALFIGALALLGFGTLMFLLNLFIF